MPENVRFGLPRDCAAIGAPWIRIHRRKLKHDRENGHAALERATDASLLKADTLSPEIRGFQTA